MSEAAWNLTAEKSAADTEGELKCPPLQTEEYNYLLSYPSFSESIKRIFGHRYAHLLGKTRVSE